MRRRRLLLVVLIAALLARLVHLIAIRRHPFYDLHTIWSESDMYQYAAWARHLAAGDWLDAETFRPYFSWQRAIAPREVWDSWFGAGVYYQPPLYPYLLALVLAAGGTVDWFRAGQLALGAANCGLVAILAARLHGRGSGLIAGLGGALYAPFIVYDTELLRGTLVIATQLLLLLALERAGGAHPPAWKGIPWPFLCGAAFGLSYLADPSILLFAPLALGWLAWTRAGRAGAASRDRLDDGVARDRTHGAPAPAARPGRAALLHALALPALFLAGAALALLPLAARNVAVGAPALSITTRGPLAFVMGNAPDARPAGAAIPESAPAILSASGYRMGATIAATLRAYGGDYLPLLAKQWEKLKAIWGAYEVPDNPSFYYAARVSPAARRGLRFPPVAALGLVGLALVLPAAARRPAEALLPLFLLSAMGLFLLAHVVSRYRQPMVVPLLILGARAVTWALERARRPALRARLAALAVPAAATALLLVLPKAPPAGYTYARPAEFGLAASLFAERGQADRAVAEMNDLIAAAASDPDLRHRLPSLWYGLGSIQMRVGRPRDALASFRRAQRLDPAYRDAEEGARRALEALASGGEAPP